ncbi:hypothetical protein Slin15195_G034990 [Septoria linicola]|uniref:F-box domain-containing protein n=1 Tax=Septoria linicola TaxID=215465 RepID=A0A9Q9AJH4_9PEZI|nr:hypothetical protein Slin15195_G034990 [Septoria linicola]
MKPVSSLDLLAPTGDVHPEKLKDVAKLHEETFIEVLSEVSHIEKLENITEMFEAVIVLCRAKDIVRMRLVNRHWKNTIDNPLQVQQALFRRPQRTGRVLQLDPDVDPDLFKISKYRIANHLPLSQIQPGTKYSIPAQLNPFICRRTPSSIQAPLDRRATLSETILIKSPPPDFSPTQPTTPPIEKNPPIA